MILSGHYVLGLKNIRQQKLRPLFYIFGSSDKYEVADELVITVTYARMIHHTRQRINSRLILNLVVIFRIQRGLNHILEVLLAKLVESEDGVSLFSSESDFGIFLTDRILLSGTQRRLGELIDELGIERVVRVRTVIQFQSSD